MDQVLAYVRDHFNGFLDDLRRLVRQPSVAASGEGIEECAALVAGMLGEAGADVKLLRLDGAAPLIVAEFAGESDRTLLFYDHYDVQPPDPLDEWTSPPFEPTVREGKLYARGVADNKGDLTSRLSAVKTLRTVHKRLPCRVKFIVEGEEEIGSVHFERYVHEHREALAGDAMIWEFGDRDTKERLGLVAGIKGICYLDLTLDATSRDLHSSVGAIVDGAATRMIWALASLKDPATGRVLVPGFYDRVREPGPGELEAVRALPFDEEDRKALYGVKSFIGGKTGDAAQHDLYFMPTCTVCGVVSGYTGPGSKTVLPRRARAKVDFRLVPDQDPEEIRDLVRAHFDRQGFAEIEMTLLGGEKAYRSPLDDPFIHTVARVARQSTGRPALLKPTSAGTGPMHPVGTVLRVPIISVGTAYWGSRGHSPDEHIRLADWEETIVLMARITEAFAQISR